jgi:hypothetical protein
MASFVNRVWTEDGEAADLGVSGVYTPVLTLTTNVAAATARLCTYCRVGQTVMVTGQLDATATAAEATVLTVSLPAESNLGTAYQLGGVAVGADGVGAVIIGDATANEASFQWTAADTNAHTITFMFAYQQVV